MRYEVIPAVSLADAEAALASDDVQHAARAVVAIGLHCTDAPTAERFLVRAASSPSSLVRGNALLALGHLARRFGHLYDTSIGPLVTAALQEEDDYVRSHAHDAADDIEHFLGWSVHKSADA